MLQYLSACRPSYNVRFVVALEVLLDSLQEIIHIEQLERSLVDCHKHQPQALQKIQTLSSQLPEKLCSGHTQMQ